MPRMYITLYECVQNWIVGVRESRESGWIEIESPCGGSMNGKRITNKKTFNNKQGREGGLEKSREGQMHKNNNKNCHDIVPGTFLNFKKL